MTLSAVQIFLVTVVVLGVGIFVLLGCSAFLGYATAQLRASRADRWPDLLKWSLLGAISIWFAAALATSTAGFISFTLVLPFTLLPIVLGTALSFVSSVEELIRAIPTHWLIFLQTYRVTGGIFIFPYLTEGVLTRGFALNAGIGDVLTGILALPVAWLMLRGGYRYRWVFLFWTAFGILDLIVAPASAAYFGFTVDGIRAGFPITMIPLFFGPPFGILIHLITVRNFWLRHVSNKPSADASSNAG